MLSGTRKLESVDVRVHGRFIVREPVIDSASRDVLVGFHGFGENAERHMDELERLPGLEAWVLVAVEALHPFYLRSGEVVACWMTRQDRELAIEENIAYVRSVLDRVVPENDAGRLAVIGFSQGTAMSYRAAAYAGRRMDAVIALGGDVPPELATLPRPPFNRALIARGVDEEWYGADKLAADVKLLDGLGVVPEIFEFAGGHEWTDAFRDRAATFLLSA